MIGLSQTNAPPPTCFLEIVRCMEALLFGDNLAGSLHFFVIVCGFC